MLGISHAQSSYEAGAALLGLQETKFTEPGAKLHPGEWNPQAPRSPSHWELWSPRRSEQRPARAGIVSSNAHSPVLLLATQPFLWVVEADGFPLNRLLAAAELILKVGKLWKGDSSTLKRKRAREFRDEAKTEIGAFWIACSILLPRAAHGTCALFGRGCFSRLKRVGEKGQREVQEPGLRPAPQLWPAAHSSQPWSSVSCL